jgi:hypothetical protein
VILYSSSKTAGRLFADKLSPLDRKFASFAAKSGTGTLVWKLPASWEGVQKGSPQGNPISIEGKPVWRVDQLWPDKPAFTENYLPLPWNGTEWEPAKHGQGGQPRVKVENGNAHFSVRGPWSGNEGQKIVGLIFIASKSGIFTVSGKAHSKPWEGGAKIFRLGIFKKDTQRSVELKMLELPRDNSPVPFEMMVELTAGHELVFLPVMPDWHNATTTVLEDLTIQEQR